MLAREERATTAGRGWRVTRHEQGTISLLGGEISITELYELPPGLPEE